MIKEKKKREKLLKRIRRLPIDFSGQYCTKFQRLQEIASIFEEMLNEQK